MADQSVTIDIPENLYKQLRQRAQQTQRTVEVELLEVVRAVVPDEDENQSDLDLELEAMKNWSDKALWKAGRSRFTVKNVKKLENFHFKEETEVLSPEELKVKKDLLEQYSRTISVRAEAAYLLKQRGYDVSVLLKRK